MSFILDALRKSEHERQRAAMPGIAQVPFSLPRRQMPAWPLVVIIVLALAVIALGAAWWRSTRPDAVVASDGPPAPARTEIPLPLPPVEVAVPPTPVYSAPPAPQRAPEPAAPSANGPQPAAPAPAQSRESAAEAVASDAGTAPASAAETPAAQQPTLPSAEALSAQGVAVPRLRLELHAYSPTPADRFVFINGAKYVEGARIAEGPRIVSIEPNGAVLTYLGHRFRLAPQ